MTWMSMLWVFVLVGVFASVSFAKEPASKPASAAKTLNQRVKELAESFCDGKKTQAGVSAVDLATSKTLLAVDDDVPLMPASNQKLVTSAVALARLGGDYKFATRVFRCGKDVAVVGDCDPTLGDPNLAAANKQTIYAELDKWAAAVKDKCGKIEGNLVMYAPLGEYRHKDWPKNQADNWYVAPVTTLNFNNNCFDVTFHKVDGKLTPVVAPLSRFVKVVNNLKVGTEHAWSLRGSQNDTVLTLQGTMSGASDSPVSVACENPPLLLGRTLAERLVQAGVEIGGDLLLVDLKNFDESKATEIARTETPLAVVMARANKRSLNMAAEGMFLRACGDWDNGPKRAAETLEKAYGIKEGIEVADGCGLSRNNRITPAAMTKLLAAVHKRKDADILAASLPIAGVDGTMERRLTQEPYRARVLAKTGWIGGVSTLSGYVLDGEKNRAIAFSVLVNGVPGPADAKKLEETVCKLLVDSLR